ncbi:MAG TPA: helix-turn-helix domain-containing protein [Nocardioides sp.]
MSPSRLGLLEQLRGQPEPTTLAALVRLSGLHTNTVREHLDALVADGLVRRERALPSGRGRPAWLYETTGEEAATGEYAALASVLAASLAASTEDPARAGTEAGIAWGRRLARDRGAAESSGAVAREEMVRLLDDLGFAPEADAAAPDLMRLTRCPLLEAAHQHPEVVCGVHLGIIEGAYAEHGVRSSGTELVPFAEPGACLLTLPVPTAE